MPGGCRCLASDANQCRSKLISACHPRAITSGTEGSTGENSGQRSRPLTCGNAVSAEVSDVRLSSFKTVERQSLSLVGSIPIRLRHLRSSPYDAIRGYGECVTVKFWSLVVQEWTAVSV